MPDTVDSLDENGDGVWVGGRWCGVQGDNMEG
jgi:hypothetical protein